jgi:hypothetical protein
MFDQQDRSTTPLRLVSQAASTSPVGQLTGPDTVKAGLTPQRPGRQVENDEYGAFARRVLRAYARRVGEGDVEALALMTNLADDINAALGEAVKGPARARLLLRRDRLPPRHHPPGRPATMGSVLPKVVVPLACY